MQSEPQGKKETQEAEERQAAAQLRLTMKEPDQLRDARHVIVVMLRLEEEHVGNAHAFFQAWMQRGPGEIFGRLFLETLDESEPRLAKRA
jgi:hypothetical protein